MNLQNGASGAKIKTSNRIIELDGLRGFLSLWVLVFHCSTSPDWTNYAFSWSKNILQASHLAVPVFFALSGFFVIGSLRKNEVRGPWVQNFYLGRFLRIFPLWWAVLALLFIFGKIDLTKLLINMSFLFGFMPSNPPMEALVVAWSLFTEEIFYLLFPLVVPFLRGIRSAICLLLVCIFIQVGWENLLISTGLSEHYVIFRTPPRNFVFFAIGILFYFLNENNFGALVREKLKPFWATFTLEAALLTLLVFIFLKDQSFVYTVVCIFLFVTIFMRGMVFHFFRWNFLVWIGVRCYGVYLLHAVLNSNGPFLVWGRSLFGVHAESSAEWVVLAHLSIILPGTLIWAGLSWKYLEKPFRSLGKPTPTTFEVRPNPEFSHLTSQPSQVLIQPHRRQQDN